MDESNFTKLADDTLQSLFDAIEEADSDYKLDIDFLSGVLSIEMPDGGEYVINKHDASGQIWLSSPVSGASHFSYKEGKWVDSKGIYFIETIKKELETGAGVVISL